MGAVLILAREATYGVGLASDWAAYIATARNLLAGEWFVQIYGWPYLHWPPLYPLLLAAASFGVFDPYDVAGPLNAAIFGLTIFVAGQGLRRHVRRAWLVVGAVIAIMLALPLTWVASFAISEAPFILLVTLALFQADKYLERGRRSDLIWAAVFTSLAILTRYIGVTLILAIVPLMLLQRAAAPWDKARRIGLYLLIATAPVGLWLAQNALRHGRIHGPTWPSPYSLMEIVDKFCSDLAGWVFLYLPSGDVRDAAAVFVAAVLLALAVAVGYTFVRAHRKDRARDDWRPFYLFGGFALVYLVFLTATQWRIELQPLGARYLAPVYVPLLCTAVFALDRLLGYAREGKAASFLGRLPVIRILVRGRVRAYGLLVTVVVLSGGLWLAGGAELNAQAIMQANEQGLGVAAAMYIYTNRYAAQIDDVIGQSDPVIRRDFDVYRNDNIQIYVKGTGEDGAAQFIQDVPIVGRPFAAGLPLVVRRAGFTNRSLWQWQRGSDAAGWANVSGSPQSPTYVYTPTAADEGHRLRASVHYTDHHGNRVQAMTAPSLRVQPGSATGLVELLHVIPVDVNDLPDHRKQDGFEILDFRFEDFELRLADSDKSRLRQTERSVAVCGLPAYDIAAIRVGQYVPVAGGFNHIWEAEFRFPLEQ